MNATNRAPASLGSVLTGVVAGWDDAGELLVALPKSEETVRARTTVEIGSGDVGARVLLQFTADKLGYYVVTGKLLEEVGHTDVVPGR